MKILLQQVTIADPHATYNGLIKDILIVDGTIKLIDDSVNEPADQVLKEDNVIVSPGWIDIFSQCWDPGFEYKETLESCAAAAAAGGFTRIFTLPNTQPAVDSKTQVEYIHQLSNNVKIQVHPLGSITKKTEGAALAEMYDMHKSSAIAFTDGLQPLQNTGLLLKALQYIKTFNGVIIQLPLDKNIGSGGLMNEGVTSTKLGLPGLPSIAEELIIARDIKLAEYTDSAIHFTGVSTAQSIQLINEAKAKGLHVSCSVTPYHLFFCDEDLQSYNTDLKVNPPLRSRQDMMALREAVLHNEVDCIASHHLPQDWDEKVCEFEYAKPGMIGLQTAFAVVQTVLPQLSNNQLADLFSVNAGKIFNLNSSTIKENTVAELTLFSKENWCFTKKNNKSKSHNSAFINTPLKGKVIGIISKGELILNQQ